jgi:hypothetical protein
MKIQHLEYNQKKPIRGDTTPVHNYGRSDFNKKTQIIKEIKHM